MRKSSFCPSVWLKTSWMRKWGLALPAERTNSYMVVPLWCFSFPTTFASPIIDSPPGIQGLEQELGGQMERGETDLDDHDDGPAGLDATELEALLVTPHLRLQHSAPLSGRGRGRRG